MTALISRTVLAVVGTSDGIALCRFTPSLGELCRDFAAPHAWVAEVGTNAAAGSVAGALLWLTALWLMLGLLVTLASVIDGRPHAVLAQISRRITPALIRRLVIASTGASLALGPAAAVAAPTTASHGLTAPASSTWTMPASGAVNIPAAPCGPMATADPRPTAEAPPANAEPPTKAGSPTPADPAPTAEAPTSPTEKTPGPPLDPEPTADTVLVKPGDSLWRITAQQLEPSANDQQISIGWPYWYRANRQIVGRNPNLLRPGEQLTVPTNEKGA